MPEPSLPSIDKELFVRRMREVVDTNPKEFASDVGISLSALYNYLSGRRVPAVEILWRIARYSGRSMEWFLADGNP